MIIRHFMNNVCTTVYKEMPFGHDAGDTHQGTLRWHLSSQRLGHLLSEQVHEEPADHQKTFGFRKGCALEYAPECLPHPIEYQVYLSNKLSFCSMGSAKGSGFALAAARQTCGRYFWVIHSGWRSKLEQRLVQEASCALSQAQVRESY